MPSWGHLAEKENLQNKNMNRAATKVGNEGEKQTMKLLDTQFGSDPTMCIFHDLYIPTADTKSAEPANVDHLLISGNKALLIDTKSWKPGRYKTNRNKKTYRDKQPFPGADTHTLDMAANRYRNYLTRNGVPPEQQPQWTGIIVVWPTNANRINLRGIQHHPNDHTNPLTVIFCTGPQIAKIIVAMTHKEQEPSPQTINTFIKLLRKPAPR